MGPRVAVGAAWLAVGVACVVAGGPVLFALAALLALVMAFEYYRMAAPLRPLSLAGYLVVLAVLIGAYQGGVVAMLGLLALGVPLTFVLALVAPRDVGVASLGVTLLGAGWIALGVGHVLLLRDYPAGVGEPLLLTVLLGVVASDSFAYLGGRAFGRRALAPAISPQKTVEGLAFGVIGCVAVVMFAGLYTDEIRVAASLGIAVAVAVAAPLGDLFESFVKRDLRVKDSGRFFGGGHGGALDRLDALLFAGIAAYYAARLLL